MIDTDELRRWAKDGCEYGALTKDESDWVQDAADEIDALRAEIAELKRHVEVLQDYRLAAKKMIDELTKERDEAIKEINALMIRIYGNRPVTDCRQSTREEIAKLTKERDEARRWARRFYRAANHNGVTRLVNATAKLDINFEALAIAITRLSTFPLDYLRVPIDGFVEHVKALEARGMTGAGAFIEALIQRLEKMAESTKGRDEDAQIASMTRGELLRCVEKMRGDWADRGDVVIE